MATKAVGVYRYRSGTQVKWRVRWFGRYDPETGKQKRYSRTFDRKIDAERFQRDKEKQFGEGVKRDPSQETLKGYAERWLQYRVYFGGFKLATSLAYRETFDRLYDFFGPDRLLRTIDQREVREFLSSLRPKNAKRLEPLSNWAKHRVLRECSCLFGTAVKDGVLPVNYFADVKKPKLPETEWSYLKPDEFHRVLEVTPTLREKVLYVLAYTAGLRKNEALSLFWTNIAFDKGEVKVVNRPASDMYPPFHVKDHEKRTIPLPSFTVDLLSQLHVEAEEGVPFVLLDGKRAGRIQVKWESYCRQGREWRNQDWANNALRDFQRRARRAGIDTGDMNITLHDLRKSCIQNWANVLPMNVVKELAGHHSIETTAKFYSKVTPEHREAAKRLSDDLLTATDHKLTISGNLGER